MRVVDVTAVLFESLVDGSDADANGDGDGDVGDREGLVVVDGMWGDGCDDDDGDVGEVVVVDVDDLRRVGWEVGRLVEAGTFAREVVRVREHIDGLDVDGGWYGTCDVRRACAKGRGRTAQR